MRKPRLLDLFCGAGGAGVGYHRAGFEVVGVDIEPQPHYPFEFHQSDALTYPLDGFDAIHASPPCQGYSWGTRKGREERFPMLIEPTRDLLRASGLPWVIENVVGASLMDAVMLCGAMFGLAVNRHRLFESSVMLWPAPGHPRCSGRIARGEAFTVVGHGGDSKDFRIATWRRAMDIDWMTKDELVESIPPAYAEWVGQRLMAYLESVAA